MSGDPPPTTWVRLPARDAAPAEPTPEFPPPVPKRVRSDAPQGAGGFSHFDASQTTGRIRIRDTAKGQWLALAVLLVILSIAVVAASVLLLLL